MAGDQDIFELIESGNWRQFIEAVDESFYDAALTATMRARAAGIKVSDGRKDDEPDAYSRRMAAICAALKVYNNDFDKTAEFLSRKHVLLGGSRPLDLAMQSEEGLVEVVRLLGRAAWGVAV